MFIAVLLSVSAERANAADASGRWTYGCEHDERLLEHCSAVNDATQVFTDWRGLDQAPTLQIGCFWGTPTVIIDHRTPVGRSDAIGTRSVRIRLDDGALHYHPALVVGNLASLTEPDELADQLAVARVLVYQFEDLRGQQHSVTFDLTGGDDVIARVREGCESTSVDLLRPDDGSDDAIRDAEGEPGQLPSDAQQAPDTPAPEWHPSLASPVPRALLVATLSPPRPAAVGRPSTQPVEPVPVRTGPAYPTEDSAFHLAAGFAWSPWAIVSIEGTSFALIVHGLEFDAEVGWPLSARLEVLASLGVTFTPTQGGPAFGVIRLGMRYVVPGRAVLFCLRLDVGTYTYLPLAFDGGIGVGILIRIGRRDVLGLTTGARLGGSHGAVAIAVPIIRLSVEHFFPSASSKR